MAGTDGNVHLIRERENLDTFKSVERVPDYLKF